MGYSISSRLLFGSLEEKFAQAADAGFARIDLNALDVTTSSLAPRDIAKCAKAHGLEIYKYQPFYGLEGLSGAAREATFARFGHFLQAAADLGASLVLLGSSSERALVEADYVADFQEAAFLAEAHGLRIALLALPWAQNLRTTHQAYQMVEAVDCANFGLAMNSYFALADGSKPAAYRDLDGAKIFSVQLADAPVSQFDISRFKHEFACLPGLGDLSLVNFVRILAENGYRGHWSLARMGERSHMGAHRARDGMRALSNTLDLAHEFLGDVPLGVEALPARDRLTGYEYLEFVVDAQSGQEMRDLLTCLCFRLERRHKTKPVELWRQGAINIVVNQAEAGFARSVFEAQGAGLCDMGFRVVDAAQMIERAARLGVEAHHQPVGDGELQIPAIQGVGQSILRFVDERSNLHHVWEIEFVAVPANQTLAPAGLRRIDHLAQIVAHEHLDHWLLFYLSMFEMKKSPPVDVLDPSGVVYSRALESPEGEVRLNLNGASSQQTFSGSFLSKGQEAGVQHIAFASDDIFETAARLDAMGFARLSMPENYYAELAVNFGLDAAMVERLREANILYARDGRGEYFQMYSQPIWDGFFVEIVERRGGYAGYGARNAPVRLAAQQEFLREAARETACESSGARA